VRGTLASNDLASPHPLAGLLPGLFQDDDLVLRFTDALDTVLAPVLGVLDSGDAYVDPRLAPLDFVTWLAQWVGAELDASWPEDRQRALVARAAELYAWRGTVRGLSTLVEITTGVVPEIEETGGVTWTGSAPPAGQLPGSAAAAIVVRVRVPRGETVDPARLDRMVAAAKPAHVSHRVEVVGGGSPSSAVAAGGQPRSPSGPAAKSAAPATKAARAAKKAAPTGQQPSATPRPVDGSGLDEPWTDGG